MDDKKWRFQVPGGLIGRKSLTLEEDIDFWLERQQKWFFGYATATRILAGQTPKYRPNPWVIELIARRGRNKACVAMANKTARIAWSMLAQGTEYRHAA